MQMGPWGPRLRKHYQEKLEGGEGSRIRKMKPTEVQSQGYSVKVAPGAGENGRPCPGRKLSVAEAGAHKEARESEGIR